MGGNVAEALRIEHLSKTFPGQVALDDVALDVGAGEVHALVGQNGSGKSTLIKILAGYHQPDPGRRRRGPTDDRSASVTARLRPTRESASSIKISGSSAR